MCICGLQDVWSNYQRYVQEKCVDFSSMATRGMMYFPILWVCYSKWNMVTSNVEYFVIFYDYERDW